MSRRAFLRRGAALGGGVLAAPLLLGSCGGGDGSGGQAALDPEARVSIEFIRGSTGEEAVVEGLENFREENPNITLNDRVLPGFPEMVEATQAAIAAGQPPALAWEGYNYLRYVAENLPHLRIDEAARREGRAGEEFLNTFPPEILALGQVGGVQHGLPWGVSTPMVYYNADLLEQAGFGEPPRTWEEVREASRRVSERTGRASFVIGVADLWQYQAIVESNGARMLEGSEGNWSTGIDGPEAIEAMQVVYDMATEDGTLLQTGYEQGIQAFNSGRAAMLYSSSAEATKIVRGSSDLDAGSVESPVFGDKPRRIPAGSGNLFIFAEDEQQQLAAWELAKHLNSPEFMTAWTRESGIFPGPLGLLEDPDYLGSYVEENRILQAAVDQMEDVVPFVSWPGPNGVEASQIFFDACNRIATGDQEPSAALRGAAERINGLIG